MNSESDNMPVETNASKSRDATFRYGDVSQRGRMRILVVDDQPTNIALLEDILATAGYKNVRSISDARTALDTCREYDPDLVLLDLMMPHVGGIEILQALRSDSSTVFLPVIVLTADANEEARRNGLRAGATDFLLKPFDETEVLLRITNLLEMRRLQVQLDTQRAAFEEAVRERSLQLREAQSHLHPAGLA